MTTRLGPLRRLVLLSTSAVSLALLAGTGLIAPVQAQAPAGVTGADLPQVTRVDNVFPYLEGGTRELARTRQLDVLDSTCRQSADVPVASARWAFYPGPGGETAFFQGKEDPTFFVLEFATRAEARQGFAALRTYVDSCDRRVADEDVVRRVEQVHVPRLGERTLGYRTFAVVNGNRRQDLEVYVLQGKRIERSWIQLDQGRIVKRHAVAMARMLRDTAR